MARLDSWIIIIVVNTIHGFTALEHLPTDDGGIVPDPIDSPPDESLVGEDLKAAAASRQRAPSGT